MGTIIPPPPIIPPTNAGGDCSICWGLNKPFGDGGTPDKIIVILSGIHQGPNWVPADGEALDGEFILDQLVPAFCRYALDDLSGNTVAVHFNAGNTFVFANPPSIVPHFVGTGGICSTLIFNQENDHFKDGTCRIYIPGVV